MAAADIITSTVTGGVNNHVTTSEEANAYATDFVDQGVVGAVGNTNGVAPSTGSFAVNQSGTPAMTVDISLGTAYVAGIPSGQAAQVLRAKMASNYTAYPITANSSGSTKYDWIYLSLDATKAANPSVTSDDVITLFTSRSTSNVTDNGTPPTYGIVLATITVANGASSIVNGNIADKRSSAILDTGITSSDYNTQSVLPTSVAYNGQRSYTLTYPSSVASIKSPGQRNRIVRTVAAPTQCASLNGTNQYWVKTSPNKLTGTNNFSFTVKCKLSAYQQGVFVSRFSTSGSANGWVLWIPASGQVTLEGDNAGGYRRWQTYQSLPLNKWVEITARLDMTSTATSGVITIDGVDVPVAYTTSGSPTTWANAGNLEIGTNNGGASPFAGKLAQVGIFSALIPQATLITYSSQGLTGSETSLASAYSFNGVATDLNTTTPNDLTAQGSAGYAADSPFGNSGVSSTVEYGITTSVASDGLTEIIQVPEGCAIPTTGGVSGMSYSGLKSPYGFPSQKDKWTLKYLNKVSTALASPTALTWYNPAGSSLYIPTGAWTYGYSCRFGGYKTPGTALEFFATLSTGSSTNSDSEMVTSSATEGASATYATRVPAHINKTSVFTSPTTEYLNLMTSTASVGDMRTDASSIPTIIFAENAYL